MKIVVEIQVADGTDAEELARRIERELTRIHPHSRRAHPWIPGALLHDAEAFRVEVVSDAVPERDASGGGRWRG